MAVIYNRRQIEANQVRGRIEELGRRCLAVQAGVASAGEVARLVETVEQDLGPVDILANNAGITRP